jgi:hypothetical protein
VGVRLYRVLFDQELNSLVERGGHRWGLLAKEDVGRLGRGQAHYVIFAHDTVAAVRIETVSRAI